jgi:hypothetical protein
MQPVHRLLLSAALIPCVAAILPHPATARQTTVTGSIATGYDQRDRTYDQNQTESSDDDQQKIFISPTIAIHSQGVYDMYSFQYTPSLNYDFNDSESTIDHHLALSAQRMLTSRWSLSLTDQYTLSDDPESSSTTIGGSQPDDSGEPTDTPSTDVLSRDQSGRRYWTNTAGIRTSYALFEKTHLGGGYTYSVLRNEEGSDGSSYDEYDKHSFSTNVSHAFNANWRSRLGLNYTRGLYDEPPPDSESLSSATPDLDQYGLSAGIDYVRSVQDFFPLQYTFSETQYDGDSRSDTQSHEWSIGWDHAFDAQTRFAIGGGPSYAKTQGMEGSWGYNAYLNFTKSYQHLTYSIQLNKQYETNNFSGTDESGLTDTYNALANLTYQYTKDLGLDFFGRYSKQSQIDPQGKYRDAVTGLIMETQTGDNTYDTDIYEAGVGLRYAFGRWYTAGLRYSYYVSDGQLDEDQYDEHRIILSVSASKELWRW